MKLPSLENYKQGFINQGVKLPLPTVPYKKDGLLAELPAIPGDKQGWGWGWTEETDPALYDPLIEWPKLSIVMPSYNQEQFVEKTIRCILLQNYPNLEFIVIDGGSNDNSEAIIEKYSPWISFWQSKKDDGQGNAINLGFSLASGQYYAWINSDDYYLKNVFHLVITKFMIYNTSFIYGYTFDYIVKTREFKLITILPYRDYFIKIPTLSQPACFWKASIHQPIWEDLYCAIDFELWLRMLRGEKRIMIKQPLAVAQVHEDAKTSDPKMKEKWHQDHLKIWSAEGHGPVPEWNKIIFLNRIRSKLYKWFSKST